MGTGEPLRNGALARMATTGIYLLRGVSRGLQQAARARAVREGTTLRRVLVQGLHEYAAGTWTPGPDDTASEPMAKFTRICASQNDLFALDAGGHVHQYNFSTQTWERLLAHRSQESSGRGNRGTRDGHARGLPQGR